MSYVTRHIVEGSQLTDLVIERSDKMGPGGAPHYYSISGFNSANNDSSSDLNNAYTCINNVPIIFQYGTVTEKKLNGITIEALLAITEDRLNAFQSGEYACHENDVALNHINKALDALHSRTKNRMARQVEGKMER